MSSEVNISVVQTDVLLRSAVTDEDIELRGVMRIGREQDCEIQLDDRHISRYHSKLSVTDEGIILEDLRSTNGTYVNGIRINSPQTVSVGDELRFHNCLFRLVSDQSADLDATVFGWPVNTEIAPPISVPELDLDSRTPSRASPAVGAAASKSSNSTPASEEEFEPIIEDPMPDLEFEAEDLPVAELAAAPPRERSNRPSAIDRQMRRQEYETEDFVQRVLDLQVGIWMALSDDEHDTHALCKLVGRSRDASRLYFVSDLGLRVFEKSSRELAQDLQYNRAYPLERGPILGRIAVILTGAERRGRNGRVSA